MNRVIENEKQLFPLNAQVIVAALAAILFGGIAGIMYENSSLLLAAIVIVAVVLLTAKDIIYGLIVMMVATQMSQYRFSVADYTVRPDQLVLVIILAVGLIMFMRGRIKLYSTLLDFPVIGLLVVGLISSYLYSPDPAYSYQALFLQTVYSLMYLVTANIILNHRNRVDLILKVLMVTAVIHAAYAIIALIMYTVGLDIGGISAPHLVTLSVPSTSGFFQEANVLGEFAAITMTIFLALLISRSDYGFSRKFIWAGFILLSAVTLTAMTRSVWIGVILAMFFLPFFAKPKHNIINPKAVGIIIAVALLLIPVFAVINYTFAQTSTIASPLTERIFRIADYSSGSALSRTEVQEIGLREWRNHFYIGNGVLSIDEETNAERGWLFSSMIERLHDTGLIGGILMLWIHFVPFFYALWASAKSRTAFRKACLFGLALGVLILVVASQSSNPFWLGFPWIYLGIVMAVSKVIIDESKRPRWSARTTYG